MVPRNNAPHRYMGSFYMKNNRHDKKNRMGKNYRNVKLISLTWFLKNYYQLSLNDNTLTLDKVEIDNEMNAFEQFLETNCESLKSHNSFWKWIELLKRKLEKLNKIENTDFYQSHLENLFKNYESSLESYNKEELEECIRLLTKKIQAYRSTSSISAMECSDDRLMQNRHQERLLKELQHACDLQHMINIYESDIMKDMKNELYVLKHRKLVENLVCNLYLVDESDISREDVLTGCVLFVQDEANHVIPYLNPYRIEEYKKKYQTMSGDYFPYDIQKTLLKKGQIK